jgi:ABC-type transport system involved in multi-copper enzyme maturation permease subunit
MLNALFDNPVVTKELRGRMRGAKTYWLLFGYVLLLSLILFFSYLGWWAQHSTDMENGGSSAGFTVGRTFFKILFYSQAVMMALITPALTAGAISVEREQRTFELLRGSILRPGAIVWGKLASSVSFVVLLLTSSLPLLSLCFLLGGVSPGEVFFAYLLLIGDAFLFGAIGLCWSAYAANTATATVLSYLTLIVFFVATVPFSLPTFDESGNTPSFGLCAVNPLGAVTGAVVPEHYYGFVLPAWVPAIVLNGTLTALLILAAMNRLEDFPARRAAALRLVMLLFGGLLVFFGNGVVLGLVSTAFMPLWMQMLFMLLIAAALLLLFVPVLVTGDLDNWPIKRGWSPLRILTEASLPSGLPLALLLAFLTLGLTLWAVHLAPIALVLRANSFAGPLPTHLGVAAASSVSTIDVLSCLLQGGAMLVLVVVGMSGVGFLLSVLLQNRWSSLTLLYLALILAIALPFFSYGILRGPDAAAAAHSPAVNSLYLCPFYSLIQLSDTIHPGYKGIGYDDAASGMIGFQSYPLWAGTGVVYGVIGLVSYTFGWVLVRRRKSMRSAELS